MTLKILNDELKKIFCYKNFYDIEQEEATLAVWKSKNDVYINLRPGGGKSLCFQLPTILKPRNVTIVFVPTHILAQDHIEILHRHNIKAEYVHSRMLKKQHQDLLDSLETEKMNFQFIYATTNKATVNFVKKLTIKLNSINALAYIVFDEAHCISELSHDYLPTYRNLAKLMKDVCPNIKKIALSGTSTAEVRQDVIDALGMRTPQIYMPSRDYNVAYHYVRFMDTIKNPIEDLKSFIQWVMSNAHNPPTANSTKCGIIFCRKKETLISVVRSLNDENISVGAYHGDLSLEKRTLVHKDWLSGRISVIATTRNFGIGLQARPVDFTVHWSMPTSMQQLFQETGRVNRRKTRAYCRVYFSSEEENDIMTQIKSMLGKSQNEIDVAKRKLRFFQEVIDYCQKVECRNIPEWIYFGQSPEACKKCDVCKTKASQQTRLQNFLQYRESVLNKMIDDLELSQCSKTNAIETPIKQISDSIAKFQPVQNKLREEKCVKLQKLLLENYKCCKSGNDNGLEEDDIVEVARQLENSVHISAKFDKKYRHVIGRKIQIIRSCTDSGLICGYLKFCQVETIKDPAEGIAVENSINSNEPAKVLVNNAPEMKRKRVEEISKTAQKSKKKCFVSNTAKIVPSILSKEVKPSIVCVDLSSDSD